MMTFGDIAGGLLGSDLRADPMVDAVLFDLHNTTLDGSYVGVGLHQVADVLTRRFGVPADDFPSLFVEGVRSVMTSYVHQDFYLMREVFVDALRIATARLGIDALETDLHELDDAMWAAGVPAAQPVAGALETFDALRAAGVAVGLVSFADEPVFEALIERLGFDGHVDVAVCSETARSCKPHPGIFRHALAALGVAPDRAMFVGDTIDADVVGGNRMGMITVLVDGSVYTNDVGVFGDDPVTVPDHRLGSVRRVADLVLNPRGAGD